MDLNDYEDPTDPYAPRPKASQAVAAAKRAAQPGRPSHENPEPIAPVARPVRPYLPFGIGAALLIVLMIGAASYQLSRLPGKPLAITPTTTAHAFATTPAVAAQDGSGATEAPTAVPQVMINAYAAPDGLLLGQIEADRAIVPVAHYGSGWVQADVAGSGLVWLRAVDVPGLAIVGPDLAPVAAPPQTGQGLTLNDWTPPPPLATAPDKGTKPAADRAARHATAVARDQQTHGSK